MGMVRTFQLTKVLSKLTVIENMRIGATGQKGERLPRRCSRPSGAARRTTITAARPTRCWSGSCWTKKREDFAGSLSGGQRKLLEMARALMAEPELVMLDEPMAGVNPALKQSLLDHVKSLRDEGTHRAVRRARHGHGARHLRLGDRDGPGARSSRGPAARGDAGPSA